MKRILFLLTALVFLAGCGGKSNATGEVISMDKICAYEKWKTVAVEGYLDPETMTCTKASSRKRSGVVWCSFKVYAEKNLTGAGISVEILIAGWIGGKNNCMDGPPSKIPDLRIYDNDGNPIPLGSKIRVFGELPKSDKCEFGLADRIERIS